MKIYPLTSGQKINYLSHRFSYSKAVSNVNILFHMKTDMDETRLQQALYLALLRNPGPYIRLTKNPKGEIEMYSTQPEAQEGLAVTKWKGIYQYYADEALLPVEIHDYREKGEESMMKDLLKISGTPFKNGSFDIPLFRAWILRKPEGKLAIFFSASHLVYDAFAMMELGSDILGIYDALSKKLPIPEKKNTFFANLDKELNYGSGGEVEKAMEFFDSYYATEPVFCSVNGLGSKEFMKGTRKGTMLHIWQIRAGFINKTIPKELVKKAEDFALKHMVALQAIYLLILRNYLSMVNGAQEDVTFINTVARRATLIQKNGGGTMVNAMQLRFNFSNELTVMEALAEVQKIQNQRYRHADLPMEKEFDYLIEKYGVKPGQGYTNLSLTFQPYMVAPPGDLRFSLERLPNGYSTMGLYLTIMAADDSGDLLCNYEYIKGYMKEDSIHQLHNYLLYGLEKALDHPELTLKELMPELPKYAGIKAELELARRK